MVYKLYSILVVVSVYDSKLDQAKSNQPKLTMNKFAALILALAVASAVWAAEDSAAMDAGDMNTAESHHYRSYAPIAPFYGGYPGYGGYGSSYGNFGYTTPIYGGIGGYGGYGGVRSYGGFYGGHSNYFGGSYGNFYGGYGARPYYGYRPHGYGYNTFY